MSGGGPNRNRSDGGAASRPEGSGRSGGGYNSRPEGSGRSGGGYNSRPERSDRPSYGSRPQGSDRGGNSSRPERSDRPSYGSRPEGSDRSGGYNSRPERSDRPSYGSRPQGSDRGGYNSRPEGSGRSGGYNSRPERSDRPSYGSRPQGSDRGGYNSRPPERADRGPRPPFLPRDLDLKLLPRGVRAELRGLPPERADTVGGHLLMAGQLIEDDPQLAHRHAVAAKQGAPRLPIVREAVGETAYAAGEYAEALAEFRALRRMTGTDEYIPAMADCERALGRYPNALKLVREGLASGPEVPAEIELRLVEAGIRADSGQLGEAVRLLQQEIEGVGTRGTKLSRARLRYAYADLLERAGDTQKAEQWFSSAATLDLQGATDAADRLARLRGLVIEFDDSDDEELDETADDADETDDMLDDFEEGVGTPEEDSEPDDSELDDSELDDSEPEQSELDGAEPPESELDGAEPAESELDGAEPPESELDGAEPAESEPEGAEPKDSVAEAEGE